MLVNYQLTDCVVCDIVHIMTRLYVISCSFSILYPPIIICSSFSLALSLPLSLYIYLYIYIQLQMSFFLSLSLSLPESVYIYISI